MLRSATVLLISHFISQYILPKNTEKLKNTQFLLVHALNNIYTSFLTYNSEALVNGTTDGNASFKTEVFDYRVKGRELPFFDCNTYDKLLRHDNVTFDISKLVKLVENDAKTIFDESEIFCKEFPDHILF